MLTSKLEHDYVKKMDDMESCNYDYFITFLLLLNFINFNSVSSVYKEKPLRTRTTRYQKLKYYFENAENK